MQSKCTHLHPDCLDSVLCDWKALGLHYGYFLIEWAQNDADKIMLINIDGLLTAFVCKDMIFFGVNNHMLPQSWSSVIDASEIAFVQFRWRAQKYTNNGETITQTRHADSRLSPVLATLRIRNRARRFNDQEHFPLEIYGASKKTSSFITNRHLTIHL